MDRKSMNSISIALAFDYLEEINYALVHSKMNICNWCIIENNSEMDMENILLEISGEYVETYFSMPFRLDARQRIRIQDIKLQVNTSKLLSLTERVVSCLILRIKNGEEVFKELSFPITFMAYNQWHGIDTLLQPPLNSQNINRNWVAGLLPPASFSCHRGIMPIVRHIHWIPCSGDILQFTFFYQFAEDTAGGRLYL